MALKGEDFGPLSDVLRGYELSTDDFNFSDAPAATTVPSQRDGSLDLLDGVPVGSPLERAGDLPLCVLRYHRASTSGVSVPVGVYLAVLGGNQVRLVPPQGEPIPIVTLKVGPLLTGRAGKLILTRDAVMVRTAGLEVSARPGPTELMTDAERAELVAQVEDLVTNLLARGLLRRGKIDSSGALAGVDRDARFFVAAAVEPPVAYGEPLGVLSVLPGPPLALYAAPFQDSYRDRQTPDSTTDVPEGRYLMVLDVPGQVRLLSADGQREPILVGEEPIPMIAGAGLGCVPIWGRNVGC